MGWLQAGQPIAANHPGAGSCVATVAALRVDDRQTIYVAGGGDGSLCSRHPGDVAGVARREQSRRARLMGITISVPRSWPGSRPGKGVGKQSSNSFHRIAPMKVPAGQDAAASAAARAARRFA